MTFSYLLGESAKMAKAFTTAVVLSAGKGTRMRSSLPKSLHPVAGRPILARILMVLKKAKVDEIRVVINEEHKRLIQPIAVAFKGQVCPQGDKPGTAQAVMSAGVHKGEGDVLIINGDHPLVTSADLENLIKAYREQSADLCVGVCVKKEPGDYGRIIRQGGEIVAIAEKDSLTHESQKITEVNAGIYMARAGCLNLCLPEVGNQNPKGEYGLTDMVSIAVQKAKKVVTVPISEAGAYGVNTQKELAFVSKKIFTAKLNQLMDEGVIIVDPLNTYIEEDVRVGRGSVIYPGVYLKGRTGIGAFCAIEPHSFIMDSFIHDLTLIRAGSYLESAEVGTQSVIGPYARLRPGTKIGRECKVGNFVEIKKTGFGDRSKASHLSYIGDAEVGEDVNIGCGTVTCNLNLDGKKYPTHIGNKVFIGSGVQMVAPVKIGDGSAVGAGSVVTEDVPERALAVGRSPQKNLKDYFGKTKKPE